MQYNAHVLAWWRWIIFTGYDDGSVLVPLNLS